MVLLIPLHSCLKYLFFTFFLLPSFTPPPPTISPRFVEGRFKVFWEHATFCDTTTPTHTTTHRFFSFLFSPHSPPPPPPTLTRSSQEITKTHTTSQMHMSGHGRNNNNQEAYTSHQPPLSHHRAPTTPPPPQISLDIGFATPHPLLPPHSSFHSHPHPHTRPSRQPTATANKKNPTPHALYLHSERAGNPRLFAHIPTTASQHGSPGIRQTAEHSIPSTTQLPSPHDAHHQLLSPNTTKLSLPPPPHYPLPPSPSHTTPSILYLFKNNTPPPHPDSKIAFSCHSCHC